MGANTMIKTAGEYGDKWPFKAMVSVNNPFELNDAFERMQRNSKVIPYASLLVKEIRGKLFFRKPLHKEEEKMFDRMV